MNCTRLHPRNIRRSVLASAVACCFAPALAWANPVGPAVTHGQASFNAQGKSLTITNSPGTIINWKGFSIGAGETTRFVQQSTASAVLNRVVGRDPSAIFGALQSNGRVFLINPNGILFGAGAQINTAGLVASTLDIMDADFLMGRMRFGNTPGAGPLSNAGEIRTPMGGRVLLISPEGVENTGIIHSPKGEVILAAGKSVELTDSANSEVRIEISAPEARALNLGKIVAESGRVGIYGAVVANRGVVSADTAVVGENGKIVFKATHAANLEAGSITSASGASGGSVEVDAGQGTTLVAGSVTATGNAGSGGEVRLLGERVGLVGEAAVDVSGERGGGAALVGGDLQGANAAVRNAQMTYVGEGASIKADAGASGDGGKVIVWADDTTRSYGSISARGGKNAGNGGFVETSGKLGLDVRRGPDLRAPAGKSGTWLLDPNDLDVVAGAGLDPTTNTGAPFFAPLTDSSMVGVDLLNAQLDFGSNVILTTTSVGPTEGTQQGNITIHAPILKSASSSDDVFIGTTSLTMQAHNNIVIMPGASITSTGDPLNVVLQANSDATGGGGITIGGAIITRGGSFTASGADAIAANASINTMNPAGTFGGSVQFNSIDGGVNIAAPVAGGFFSAFAQNGAVTVASAITSTSSVSLSGSAGVNVAAGASIATGTFGSFSATATDPGAAVSVGAGASVTSRGATLTADNMDIQGVVNAGNGTITVRQNNSGRAINLGTEIGSALSLTQLELDRLLTTGTFSLGNTASGAITVNGMVSIISPSFVTVTSGASYTQNAGVTLSGGLSINAPAMTIGAPLTAGTSGITFTTDSLSVGSAVTSGGNLDIATRTFSQPIQLGIAAATGTALELTDGQLDLLSTPTRLRFSGAGPITIAGPISPALASTLSLSSSSNNVTQALGAAITVPNLAVSAFGLIDLQQGNNVDNLAAQIVCCSGGDINFVAAAGKLVNIGTVDGLSGVRVNNFFGTGNIKLQADDLNIAQAVLTNTGSVKLLPMTPARTVTLGADVAGTLGLTGPELLLVQGTDVAIAGDLMDIAAAVTFPATTTTLGPVTADRAVAIVGAKGGSALELLPAELNNLTGATVVLGGANAGPVSVQSTTAVPNTINKLVLHSGGSNPATTSSVTVGSSTPLSATNSIGITADSVDLQSAVSSSNGSIEIATHTPTRTIDLGTDPGTSLGLTTIEIGLLSAPAGTIFFSTSSGNIDVTGTVSFPNVMALALDAGGTFTLLSAGALSSGGALSVRAPIIDIQGMTSMSAGGTGSLTLTGNTLTINPSGTTITAGGDINVMPRDFRSIDLGGAGSGSAIGLDNSELATMTPTGVLRIGETLGFTSNIFLSSAVSLPGRTLSLKTGSGSISQTAGAILTAASLAAKATGAIALNELNQVGTVALHSDFSSVAFTRAPGAPLVVGSVDGLTGIFAGSGSFASPMPVSLRADQIDIDQTIRGSSVTLLPTAGTSIDVGTRSGFGFAQADFDRIIAASVTIGEAASDDITITAPINVTTFNDLTLVSGNTANVASMITVPGNLSITASSLTTSAALTGTGGNVTLVTDALTLGAAANAFNSITVRPLTGAVRIDLGGADGAGVLGITAAEMINLMAPTVVFGPTPRVDVTAPVSTTRSVQLIADDFTIPSAGVSLTAANLAVSTVTSGRTIDLGTSGVGTFMGLDVATLAKLMITDTLSFSAPGASTITVSTAGLVIPANDLSLSAGTININESLAVTGDLALRSDAALNIAAGKTASSSGGGDIEVAPRSGPMTFGAGGLLNSTTLAQLSTSGFVELGDSNTAALTIAQPLSAGAGWAGLLLTASGNISQTAGSIITASKLGVQSNSGSVTLTENNAVTTLAGLAGSFNTFSFTNAAPLTIGTVDSLVGVTASSGTVTLRADGLNIVDPITASTVTLAPRLAGTAIDLGSDVGFGLTDAELDKVFAFTLNIGSNTTNPSGPITVSAPVDRSSGSLNLFTAPGSSIAVNAALGSASTGAISMNAGAGGSVAIAAPVVSSSNVAVTADAINTSQPITSDFGGVFLSNVGTNGSVNVGGAINARSSINVTARTIAVNAPITSQLSSVNLSAPTGASGSSATVNGAITAGSSITITTDSLALNAPLESGFAVTLQPRSNGTAVSLGAESVGAFSVDTAELALIDAGQLTVGSNNAGDLMVNAPIGPFSFSSLVLRSGGDVSQAPGATITVRNVDPNDPSNVTGSLTVSAGGTINLPEANDIAVSISGSASGTDNNFVFNNITPLRLQNVSGIFASGKVLVRTAQPSPAPPSGSSIGLLDPSNAVLVGLEKAGNPGEDLKKSAEDRKDEAEERDREEQRKRGTQSCS
ncbi:MAG: filamentous hemagglutinin N-terminal domain-containing protein [Betaproteobacteria bacterium]|nr:filamentous hemagglutinin N-terminal domain-containing protein [Betaproteobacteria bacterium]